METTLNPVTQLYCTTHPAMGTEYSLYLYAPSREEAAAIAEPIFAEVDRVDALLSNYRPGSELSRINREAFDHEPGSFSRCRPLPSAFWRPAWLGANDRTVPSIFRSEN